MLGGKPRIDKTYKRIIAHIREAISSGELRAGDRLPPETELASKLGVSQPTVREALKALETQNVLSSSTGPTGGTFVDSINGLGVAEYLRDSISLLLDVDELTLEELWAAREVIDIVSPDVRRIFQQQHQLIYEAISNKGEASARIRMQDHLPFLMGSIGKLLHSREP